MFLKFFKVHQRRKSFDIVIFLTGMSDGISGGDVHALRFAEYVASEQLSRVVAVAPRYLVNLLPPIMEQVLDERYRLCDCNGEGTFRYVVVNARRLISTVVHSPKAGLAVSSSHFLNDVLAAIFHQLRHNSECVMYVHHIVGLKQRHRSPRSMVSIAQEYLSLRLALAFKFKVLVVEAEAEDELLRIGFARDQMARTTNCGGPWGEELVEPAIPSGRSAVYLGRVAVEKGIHDLVHVAKKIQFVVPDVVIDVLGGGPAHQLLLNLIARENVHNMRVWGFVSETQKWSMLRRASLMLAPSVEEGWGIAVDEAVSVGLPVIAYDLPAYERLTGKIAMVPPGDVAAFAELASKLLTEPSALEAYRELLKSYEGSRWATIAQTEFDWLSSKTSFRRD